MQAQPVMAVGGRQRLVTRARSGRGCCSAPGRTSWLADTAPAPGLEPCSRASIKLMVTAGWSPGDLHRGAWSSLPRQLPDGPGPPCNTPTARLSSVLTPIKIRLMFRCLRCWTDGRHEPAVLVAMRGEHMDHTPPTFCRRRGAESCIHCSWPAPDHAHSPVQCPAHAQHAHLVLETEP